jgi:hypothetical protein
MMGTLQFFRSSAAAVGVLGLLGAAPALAADDGVALGPLVVRPSIGVGLVVDSNVYAAPSGAEQLDLGVQVRPEIQLEYPGENFRWDFASHYRFFTYFNLQGNNHNDLRVVTQFGVRTAFDVNRKGKVGFEFSPEVFNTPFARGFANGTEQRFGAYVPLNVHIRPTTAFTISPKATWKYERAYYPELTFGANSITLGNRHEIGGGLGVDWRFFPRSHVVFDSHVGTVQWGQVGNQTNNINWKVWGGVRGDITRKLSLLAMLGYGNIYFGSANSANNLTAAEGLLGKVELGIRPLPTQRIGIGFGRDFQFQYFTDRLVNTQAYVTYKGLFAERVGAKVDFSYVFRNMVGALTRNEHQVSAGAGVDVKILEWLSVGGSYRFAGVVGTNDPNDAGKYLDHRGLVELTFGYKSTFKSAVIQ